MNQAVIAAGSNIEPLKHVEMAIESIAAGHKLVRQTKATWTKPVGVTDQPDFLNLALLIETQVDCRDLNQWLKDLEDRLGRVRSGDKFGPRTIDLDIVVWNGQIVDADVYARQYLFDMVKELLPELNLDRLTER